MLANGSAKGIAACPGPPASATTASLASPTGARWRRSAKVIVPGVALVGSMGTRRCPHAKLLLSAQGAYASGGARATARGGAAAPMPAARITAATRPERLPLTSRI